MAISVQDIKGEGPKMDTSEFHLANGWVWLVLRRDPSNPECPKWHIQGVGPDEDMAVEMCKDSTYLIGPLPIGTALPQRRQEWMGSYFPLKE